MMRIPAERGGRRHGGDTGGHTGTPPGPPLTDGGADERGRVPQAVQTLLLDEGGHGRGEALVMQLDVVLQDQARQGAGGLVWGGTGVRGAMGGRGSQGSGGSSSANAAGRCSSGPGGGSGGSQGSGGVPGSPTPHFSGLCPPHPPLTLRFEPRQHENEVIVEIRELVQLLQFLRGESRTMTGTWGNRGRHRDQGQ